MAEAVLSNRNQVFWQLGDNALSEAGNVISALTSVETRVWLNAMGMEEIDQIAGFFDERDPEFLAIAQSLHGASVGRLALLLDESCALGLVRELTRETAQLAEMTELEEEACCEVVNIILNSFLGTYSEVGKTRISSHLPELSRGHFTQLLGRFKAEQASSGLFHAQLSISTPATVCQAWMLASGIHSEARLGRAMG